MTEISDQREMVEKYQRAKNRVIEKLAWLRASLNHRQNSVLDELLEAVETCTEMEWSGAFETGFEMGEMCALEDVGQKG